MLKHHLRATFITSCFFSISLCVHEKLAANDDLLDLSLEELMTIEISSASKRPERISKIPASVTVILRKDIEANGYTTLTEVFENIPGLFNIYSYDGAPGNFGLRGSFNSRYQNASIVILVNGVNQLKDNDRSNPFEKITLPVEAIDRIEVIRGPMSVLYGNGASFGVVNIVTNDQVDPNNLAAASLGSAATKKLVARAQVAEKDFKLTFNGSYYRTDGIDKPFKDMTSPENFATFPDFGVTDPDPTTKDILEHENLYAGFAGSYRDFYFDVALNETNVGLFLLLPPVDEGSTRNTKSNNIMLGYQTDVNHWLNLNGRFTYNDFENAAKYDVLEPGFEGLQTIEYKSYDLELIANIKALPDLNIVTGITSRTMDDYKDFLNAPAVGLSNELVLIDDRRTNAIYVQLAYEVIEQLDLIAGYRYERLSSYDYRGFTNAGLSNENTFGGPRDSQNNHTPNVAAIYNINDIHIVKLMYGEANRISNDRYLSEEVTTFEINYVFSKPTLLASVSLFSNTLDKLLIKVLDPDTLDEEDLPAGKTSSIGVEAILNMNVTDNLVGEVAATYQKSENDNNKDIAVAYSPRTVLHGKLSYRYNKHIFSAAARYIGSMESQWDVLKPNDNGTTGDRIGEPVPAYTVLDANYRVNNLIGGMYLNIRATNILDEEIRYPNNPFNSEILDRGVLGAGRMIVGTVGFKF